MLDIILGKPIEFIKENLTGWIILILAVLIIYFIFLRNYYNRQEQFYDKYQQEELEEELEEEPPDSSNIGSPGLKTEPDVKPLNPKAPSSVLPHPIKSPFSLRAKDILEKAPTQTHFAVALSLRIEGTLHSPSLFSPQQTTVPSPRKAIA